MGGLDVENGLGEASFKSPRDIGGRGGWLGGDEVVDCSIHEAVNEEASAHPSLDLASGQGAYANVNYSAGTAPPGIRVGRQGAAGKRKSTWSKLIVVQLSFDGAKHAGHRLSLVEERWFDDMTQGVIRVSAVGEGIDGTIQADDLCGMAASRRRLPAGSRSQPEGPPRHRTALRR